MSEVRVLESDRWEALPRLSPFPEWNCELSMPPSQQLGDSMGVAGAVQRGLALAGCASRAS